MKNPPSFQFYPGDWLGSQRVQMLTAEEEGAYIRLLCYCWQHGSIPSDPLQAVKLAGKNVSMGAIANVLSMFDKSQTKGGSCLVHERLDFEREKQAVWRAKSAEGGKKSGNIRRKLKRMEALVAENEALKKANHPSTTVEPPYEPNANQTRTLQSSSSLSGKEKKRGSEVVKKNCASTAEEAEEFARSVGAGTGQGEAFFWKMEGNGWTNAGKPVKDWKATFRSWHAHGFIAPVVNPTANGKPAAPEEERPVIPKVSGFAELRAIMGDPEPERERDD